MENEVTITSLDLARTNCNGSYYYKGQAKIREEDVNFGVKTACQIYVKEEGIVEFLNLTDPSQGHLEGFPIREVEVIPQGRRIARACSINQYLIETELRNQYDVQLEALANEAQQ